MTRLKNLFRRIHREEEGLEVIQVVFIVAIAALIIVALAVMWNDIKTWAQNAIKALTGQAW